MKFTRRSIFDAKLNSSPFVKQDQNLSTNFLDVRLVKAFGSLGVVSIGISLAYDVDQFALVGFRKRFIDLEFPVVQITIGHLSEIRYLHWYHQFDSNEYFRVHNPAV